MTVSSGVPLQVFRAGDEEVKPTNTSVVVIALSAIVVAIISAIVILTLNGKSTDAIDQFAVIGILPTFASLLAYGKANEASVNSRQTVAQTNGVLSNALQIVAQSPAQPQVAQPVPTPEPTIPSTQGVSP